MTLETFITDNEVPVRLGFFFGVFAIMAVWETVAPRRNPAIRRSSRWPSNIALVFINSVVIRLLFPAAATGVAIFAQTQGWGLFNYISTPESIAILLSVVILDFFIWLQHVMVHAVPLLWRLHRVHHADLEFDVTTGSRFHTLEIILSMLIKFAVILLLGPPVVAIIIFEVILNATAMFNHSNVRLPHGADQLLRLLIVTPDMHRVHHSIHDDETNSNFGFNLTLWDRLFGTYRQQPRDGHETMKIGIKTFRDLKRCAYLPGMLSIPFIGKVGDYAINRRHYGE